MPFINVLGKRTYYHQNCDFRADLPTLLFVHGAGGTSEKWVHQLLGIEGFNLMALDLPGHGGSEGPASDSIVEYRDFVWAFAQALCLRTYFIAGHSMGGAIALELALQYPEALKGLIIIGSGARLRVNPVILELLSRGKHPLESVKFSYSINISPNILDKALEEMKSIPTEVYWADFRACNKFDIMDRVQTILKPVLVICGQEDQMTPVKYSEYLCQKITNATIARISNAGHMVMVEQPDQVNKVIQSFLASTI